MENLQNNNPPKVGEAKSSDDLSTPWVLFHCHLQRPRGLCLRPVEPTCGMDVYSLLGRCVRELGENIHRGDDAHQRAVVIDDW